MTTADAAYHAVFVGAPYASPRPCGNMITAGAAYRAPTMRWYDNGGRMRHIVRLSSGRSAADAQ
ncbi:MAG: hypothetical protein D6737_09355 [Chloroflexi bacterium]|nr:MAG: hypothetical protein D6737_09355 [Chloroflexota bacterium]